MLLNVTWKKLNSTKNFEVSFFFNIFIIYMFKKTKSIALTGSRFVGLNEIASKFENEGIPVFDGDLCFRFLIYNDMKVRSEIKKELGPIAFNGNSLNKYFIKKRLRLVLKIVEPFVFDLFYKWRAKQSTPLVIFSSLIIHEQIKLSNFHKVINVFAPRENRFKRMISCVGIPEPVDLLNEMGPDIKNERSHYTIMNYGEKSEIGQQVDTIINELVKDITITDNLPY
jgi:dephospho-CoA kinase